MTRAPLLVELEIRQWYVLDVEQSWGPWTSSEQAVSWLLTRDAQRTPVVVSYRPDFLSENPQYERAALHAQRP